MLWENIEKLYIQMVESHKTKKSAETSLQLGMIISSKPVTSGNSATDYQWNGLEFYFLCGIHFIHSNPKSSMV